MAHERSSALNHSLHQRIKHMNGNVFEKLANLSCHDKKRDELIDALPTELREAMLVGDSGKIRQVLSNKMDFPDARTVAGRNG